MNELGFFPDCPQRCLFRNEDVEAHLVGVSGGSQDVLACFSCRATLLVTFGHACVRLGDCALELSTGQQCELPPHCPLRVRAAATADVLLLLRRNQPSGAVSTLLPDKMRFQSS